MSALFDLVGASPLGEGLIARAGSVKDVDLARMVERYKRTVASRYRALTADELETLPKGQLFVSPKIDGECWFLVAEGEELALVAPNGKVIAGDLPLLREARKVMMPRIQGRLVLAGELFALRKEGRPRHGDLARARSGGATAETARIGFVAFDLVAGGDGAAPEPSVDYGERLAVMERLLDGGKRVKCVRTEQTDDHERVQALYDEWVSEGKGEGLVVRSAEIGRTFKIKPAFTLDAAVIGFTERTDEEGAVRSLLLAVMKESGQFQVVGSCGNMKDLAFRQEMHARLLPDVCESSYSHASSSGALFRFVHPKVVVEVRVTDIQGEDSAGLPVQRMVLNYKGGRYDTVATMGGVSILHPVLQRVRDDKEVNTHDVRVEQVLERIFVADAGEGAEKRELPTSKVLRREVYGKETKGELAVRKLVLWKTNKEDVDGRYPAYVVHFTDYSARRKDPLKREVRLAPDEDAAMAIADEMITANIKKGWARLGEEA